MSIDPAASDHQRNLLWEKMGRPEKFYTLWIRKQVRAWAKHHGFEEDTSYDRGVQVRTQSEATRAAFVRLGQASFTAWLEKQTKEKSA